MEPSIFGNGIKAFFGGMLLHDGLAFLCQVRRSTNEDVGVFHLKRRRVLTMKDMRKNMKCMIYECADLKY